MKLIDKNIAIDSINGMIDNNGYVILDKFAECSRKIIFAKEFDLESYSKEIRADERAKVIVECVEFIKSHSDKHYVDCDCYWEGNRELVFKVDDWLEDLEQLKEQNDET